MNPESLRTLIIMELQKYGISYIHFRDVSDQIYNERKNMDDPDKRTDCVEQADYLVMDYIIKKFDAKRLKFLWRMYHWGNVVELEEWESQFYQPKQRSAV